MLSRNRIGIALVVVGIVLLAGVAGAEDLSQVQGAVTSFPVMVLKTALGFAGLFAGVGLMIEGGEADD